MGRFFFNSFGMNTPFVTVCCICKEFLFQDVYSQSSPNVDLALCSECFQAAWLASCSFHPPSSFLNMCMFFSWFLVTVSPNSPTVLLSFSWLVRHLAGSQNSQSSRERFSAKPWRSTFYLSKFFITLPALRGGDDFLLVIRERREGKWALEVALQHRLRCLQMCACIPHFIDNVVSHILGMREPQVNLEFVSPLLHYLEVWGSDPAQHLGSCCSLTA